MGHPRTILALVVSLAIAPVATAQPELPIEPGDGIEDGEQGMMVVPALYAGNRVSRYLSGEGYEAHLADRRTGRELVYPGGEWVTPPSSAYDIWLEADGWMSPYVARIGYSSHVPRTTGAFVAVPIGPAGRVVVRAGEELAGGELQLLNAGSYRRFDGLWMEMMRRAPVADLDEAGLQMPVGRALAAVWDPDEETMLALSRPFEVSTGATASPPLERPAKTAHLLLRMRHLESGHFEDDPRVALHAGGEAREPDLLVTTTHTVHAAWYDLPPGQVVLTATNDEVAIPPTPVEIEAGTIGYREAKLETHRTLEVGIAAGVAPPGEPVTLRVRTLPATGVLDDAKLRPGDRHHRFTGLPPAVVEVEMETSAGRRCLVADLTQVDLADLRFEAKEESPAEGAESPAPCPSPATVAPPPPEAPTPEADAADAN